MVNTVLTLAGIDASGAAGATADMKTFQKLGVFGIQNITCIVSFDPFNNYKYTVYTISPEIILNQLKCSTNTYEIKAAKIGMLPNSSAVKTISDYLDLHPIKKLVVDPVLICKGQKKGSAAGVKALIQNSLIPKAYIVTPNHFEAELLSQIKISNMNDMKIAAKKIFALGAKNVFLKGGLNIDKGIAIDILYDGNNFEIFEMPKINSKSVSGSGCSLSAAITAELANGKSILEACRNAKRFVYNSIKNSVKSNAPFNSIW